MVQNTPRSTPSSNTAYPKSRFTPGSMMVMTRNPLSAKVFSMPAGSGKLSLSQVKTRYPSMYSMSSHNVSHGMSSSRCR